MISRLGLTRAWWWCGAGAGGAVMHRRHRCLQIVAAAKRNAFRVIRSNNPKSARRKHTTDVSYSARGCTKNSPADIYRRYSTPPTASCHSCNSTWWILVDVSLNSECPCLHQLYRSPAAPNTSITNPHGALLFCWPTSHWAGMLLIGAFVLWATFECLFLL
jgi:hypothetical protein